MKLMSLIATALGALLAASPQAFAQADTYPSRAVQVILPLQAGSASDVAVRIVAERMAQGLKQGMVIENVPGAAGLIGAERLRAARPDGYTLAAMNNSILTILPNIQRDKVKFDALADFVPIHGLANIPTLLGVHPDLPARNVRELIAYAKANPGRLNFSTGGPGSPQHMATAMFTSIAGIEVTQVPYKGATQAAAGLAGGQVQAMFIAHSLALPFLPSGKVRVLAFAGGKRGSAFPDLPTVAEEGVPGFDYSSWIALFAPRGTPQEVIERLRAEAARALAQADVQERLFRGGLELWPVGPEALPGVIREDDARWKRVVRDAGIKSD